MTNFWLTMLASFIGCLAAGLLMEWARMLIMAKRSRQVKEYIDDLKTCDMMLQDIESSISAISKQGGIR